MKNILTNNYRFAVVLTLAAIFGAFTFIFNGNVRADSSSFAFARVAPTPPSKTAQTKWSPEQVVADLYKQHDAQKGPFFQNKNRALVDKYFAKATADTIWKDAVETKDGEEGALGADPLYDAQDTEIKNFTVGKAVIQGDSGSVPVTFTNFGEKQTINFAVVQGKRRVENSGHQVSEIFNARYLQRHGACE